VYKALYNGDIIAAKELDIGGNPELRESFVTVSVPASCMVQCQQQPAKSIRQEQGTLGDSACSAQSITAWMCSTDTFP
jgi:hypothetical protein